MTVTAAVPGEHLNEIWTLAMVDFVKDRAMRRHTIHVIYSAVIRQFPGRGVTPSNLSAMCARNDIRIWS